MGQISSSVSKIFRSSNKDRDYDSQKFHHNTFDVTPYVFVRRGSMYYDEDGDLAHEFYEETKTPRGIKMKKKPCDQLQPQGLIGLKIPRINRDIAVILHEVQS